MQDGWSDQQVSTEGYAGSACRRRGDASGVLTPEQSPEIHAASALRTPDAQDASAAGLSRRDRAARGYARAREGTAPEGDSPLHDAAKGIRATPAQCQCSAAAFHDRGAFPKK